MEWNGVIQVKVCKELILSKNSDSSHIYSIFCLWKDELFTVNLEGKHNVLFVFYCNFNQKLPFTPVIPIFSLYGAVNISGSCTEITVAGPTQARIKMP